MKTNNYFPLMLSILLVSCGEIDGFDPSRMCETMDCTNIYYEDVGDNKDNQGTLPHEKDSDGDTIPDNLDNCPNIKNIDQLDSNQNNIGDVCETQPQIPQPTNDKDNDTIPDVQDNCPEVFNPNQLDTNFNNIGDVCEVMPKDSDADTILDAQDNCPQEANPDQTDANNNGVGDACELQVPDKDGDTVPDAHDNCPEASNADQADRDLNGIGDACDEKPKDSDGDTVADSFDNCLNIPNSDQADEDTNGIGDACESKPDADGDTVPDSADNCIQVKNPDQADFNQDGSGDACAKGTPNDPFVIPVQAEYTSYQHSANTKNSTVSNINTYPGHSGTDESGSEYYYVFTLSETSQVNLWLSPEPSGVDIDPHLLSSISPVNLIARNDKAISQTLSPGTYWIVMDTYSGNGKAGDYTLNVTLTTFHAGTKNDPIPIGPIDGIDGSFVFTDSRSTADATSQIFDVYPGNANTNEAGKEYIYRIKLNKKLRFHATLRAPEPSGTDIDLHLLSDLTPTLISRSDYRVWQTLEPGTYYLVADSFKSMHGTYLLDVQTRPVETSGSIMFNDYILKAVDYIDKNYRLLGYDSQAFTHDLPHGKGEVIKASKPPATMCVAAVAEVILTAMYLYAEETGDTSVWTHLGPGSWRSLATSNIRAHIWVNPTIKAGGTGDALTVFGMGMTVNFHELVPGSFINLNRTETGHATTFLGFIDENGTTYTTFPACGEVSQSCVIGFKYYSSQTGGFDYRYAVFSGFTLKNQPGGIKRDTGVIYKPNDQVYLNTGIIYHPSQWQKTSLAQGIATPKLLRDKEQELFSTFNAEYFNGVTSGDNE